MARKLVCGVELDLKEWLRYESGKLYWIKKPSVGVSIGDEAGTPNKTGHKVFFLKRKAYKVHRVVYWWHTGEWPEFVDHILHPVGEVLDNSFHNLRSATKAQNNRNRTSAKGSTSKYLGVSWKKESKKWVAHIRFCGKLKSLGYFTEEIEAAMAYDKAAKDIHGEFANLNFKEN